jgi:hypothetical protein
MIEGLLLIYKGHPQHSRLEEMLTYCYDKEKQVCEPFKDFGG